MMDVTIDRRKFIGGSDMGAVMGRHKYKSTLELWLEKAKGIVVSKPTQEMQDRMDIGNFIEDTIAKLYVEKTGQKVRRVNKPYYGEGEFKYIRGHVDRLIVNSDAILEIKNVGQYAEKDWGAQGTAEVPEYYEWQGRAYMYLTGRKRVVYAAFFTGSKLGTYIIHHCEEKEAEMLDRCRWFKDLLDTDTAPSAIEAYAHDSVANALDAMHNQDNTSCDATNVVDTWIRSAIDLQEQIKTLTKKKTEAQNHIKQFMGDSTRLISDHAKSITWKAGDPILKVASKSEIYKLHEDGEISNDVLEKITYMAEQPRRFVLK